RMASNPSRSGMSTSTTTSSGQNISAKPKLLVEVNIAGKIEGNASARFATR
ncbi:hypothetical protein MKX03_011190, partial [Papaver bracteatum]